VPGSANAGQRLLGALGRQKAQAGVNHSGTLYSPAGVALRALPAAVPNNAVVLVVQ